ncbi:MAG: DNA repair protein RecO [Firmicutes bacterium]|nr:DNA repair protein RecO [Bacillota bacterium]
MTSKEVSALVLDCEEYKEKDALVTLLIEDELVMAYAKGVGKLTSKNRILTQPFSSIKVFLDQKENRMPLILHGHVEKFYFRIQENLVAQSVCFVLRDCIKRSHTTLGVSSLLESVWEAFQTGEANVYTKACLCMKQLLENEGIGLYVDGCVNCSRKNHIETISLKDGGFLCSECNANFYPKRSKQELIQYYSLMRVKEDKFELFNETYLFGMDDFLFLGNWYEHYASTSLLSLRLLKSIKGFE